MVWKGSLWTEAARAIYIYPNLSSAGVRPGGSMTLTRILRIVLVCTVLPLSMQAGAETPAPLHLVTMDYPPYIFRQSGSVQGPVVSVVKEAFRRIGRPVSIEMLPWSRSLSMVSNGTADGLFTIKKTADREFTLLYPSEPVLTQEYVLFVRRGIPFRFTGDLGVLADIRLGVTANNSYGPQFDDALGQGRFRHVQTAYDHEHLFRMLAAGRIDVAICSKTVGLAFIRALQADDQIMVVDPPVMTAFSYLVFTRQRDYSELARNLEQTLVAMRRDGTLAKLLGDTPQISSSAH